MLPFCTVYATSSMNRKGVANGSAFASGAGVDSAAMMEPHLQRTMYFP